MAEIRVEHVSTQLPAIPVDSHGGSSPRDHEQPGREPGRHAGAEELAVALAAPGGAAMRARYEQDADGNARIRIVDAERGETVAVVTPEELRALAEQTGLPPGLLVQTSS